MKAAVVTDFSIPPVYADFREPQPREGFEEVRMLAAGVHQVVRSIAAGAHYSSADQVPFVPGVDGIAELDGRRIYTGGTPDPFGTISQRTLVPAGWAVPLPDALSTELAAAVVNPAMSSWLPLVGRGMRAGVTVLVLGATGSSGSLAVRIALHLGAARVIAAGRNAEILERVAADPRVVPVSLAGSREEITARIAAASADGLDVVLDYLWGPVAEATLEALRSHDSISGGSSVDYVQIGALAGATIALDAAILRARRIAISGSGMGSIDRRLIFAELPKILDLAASGELDLPIRVAPLADVTAAWTATDPRRLVVSME